MVRRIRRTLAGLILAWSCALLPASAEALTDPADVEISDPAPEDTSGDTGMAVDPNG